MNALPNFDGALMPPFKERARCPKCGDPDVAVEYCMGATAIVRCGFASYEHLHRLCRRCKFQWPERCCTNLAHDAPTVVA